MYSSSQLNTSSQKSYVKYPNYSEFLELCRCKKCNKISNFTINPLTLQINLTCDHENNSEINNKLHIQEENTSLAFPLKSFFSKSETSTLKPAVSLPSSELNSNSNKTRQFSCSDCTHIYDNYSYYELFSCKECKKIICSKCKYRHIKSASHYDFIPLSSLENKCKEHFYDFNTYCIECRKNICIFCKKNHLGHNLIELGNIIPSRKEIEDIEDELKKESSLVKKTIEELKGFQGKINGVINRITDELEFGFRVKESILTSFDYDNCLQYEKISNYLKIRDINLIPEDLKKFILGYDTIEKAKHFNNFMCNLGRYSEDEKKRLRKEMIQNSYINELNSKIVDLKSKNKEIQEWNFNNNISVNNKYLISSTEFEEQIYWIQPLDDEHLLVCSTWMELYEIKTDCCINPNFNKISHIEQGANHVCMLKNRDILVSYDKLRMFSYDKRNYDLKEKYSLEVPQDSCSINKTIELSNGLIASCDFKRIFIWKMNDIKGIYEKHKDILLDTVVRCLFQIDENTFVSTQNGEKTVRFYNVNSLEEEKIIYNIKSNGGPSVINFIGKAYFGIGLGIGINIFSIKYREKVKFIETGECVTYINPYSDFILCAVRTKNKEFSLVEYELDEYCDLVEISRKKTVHKDVTWCIQLLANGILATSSYDKSVKLWK